MKYTTVKVGNDWFVCIKNGRGKSAYYYPMATATGRWAAEDLVEVLNKGARV